MRRSIPGRRPEHQEPAFPWMASICVCAPGPAQDSGLRPLDGRSSCSWTPSRTTESGTNCHSTLAGIAHLCAPPSAPIHGGHTKIEASSIECPRDLALQLLSGSLHPTPRPLINFLCLTGALLCLARRWARREWDAQRPYSSISIPHNGRIEGKFRVKNACICQLQPEHDLQYTPDPMRNPPAMLVLRAAPSLGVRLGHASSGSGIRSPSTALGLAEITPGREHARSPAGTACMRRDRKGHLPGRTPF